DAHTDNFGRLQVDKQQNYILEDAQRKNSGRNHQGPLVIKFHRSYDTCDDEDDYIIDKGTTHLVYFNHKGPISSLDRINLMEEKVIVQRVQLLKSQIPDAPKPTDVRELVVHVDQVPVPLDETTYWCTVKKLPNFVDKHHIIKYEGAISKETQGIVHHLEVFNCQIPEGRDVIRYNAPCKSMAERPKGLESCTKVLGAWAMGADYMTYPFEAGAPIGGPHMSRFVMIEVHYNNPLHISGLVDSSGIRFYITRQLRRFDAGIMEIGLEYTDKMALPPHLPKWELHGYCIPECTEMALPSKGIYVFSSQLHTHLTGMKIYTKHIRGGIELPELNRDDHYSPHYQEIRRLHEPVLVLPGDALVTTCVDQTRNKDNVTLGGFSISDEMCVNYIHYYPLVNLEVCKSSVTTKSLYDFFDLMKRKFDDDIDLENGISYNYQTIDWTREKVDMLRNFYDTAPISMQCNKSNGVKFPVN
ncbi:hypothetical protein HELRODRAFT_64253, partial [Helobdella robusta]|uniref:Dopamine beta-hydroxylase n=1 Tax=Helobdella robusta TaxID=6412 RepID=T1FXR8_HELRO